MSADRRRFIQLLALLESSYEGEIIAAARKIVEWKRANVATWEEAVIAPEPQAVVSVGVGAAEIGKEATRDAEKLAGVPDVVGTGLAPLRPAAKRLKDWSMSKSSGTVEDISKFAGQTVPFMAMPEIGGPSWLARLATAAAESAAAAGIPATKEGTLASHEHAARYGLAAGLLLGGIGGLPLGKMSRHALAGATAGGVGAAAHSLLGAGGREALEIAGMGYWPLFFSMQHSGLGNIASKVGTDPTVGAIAKRTIPTLAGGLLGEGVRAKDLP